MKFRGKIIPSGNAAGVEIPNEIMRALGPQGRPPVAITINGHTWRSRVAAMRGKHLIGISAANRAAARIVEGDTIDVDVSLDDAPREVIKPVDLIEAFDRFPEAKVLFDRLPFGLRQKHINAIEAAKSADVRQRRINKLVANLQPGLTAVQ